MFTLSSLGGKGGFSDKNLPYSVKLMEINSLSGSKANERLPVTALV
jgi:hypothetical protein